MKLNFNSRSAASSPAGMLAKASGFDELAQAARSSNPPAVEQKFQDFVGSTFYKEMLKALRSGQKHSKYLYGGQAEEIFRGQMDQQISEDLAHSHARHLAAPLFDAYARQSLHQPPQSAPGSERGHALNAVA